MQLTLATIVLLAAAATAAPTPQTIGGVDSGVLSSVVSQFPEITSLASAFEAGETAVVKSGLSSLEANPSFQSIVAANPTVSSINAEVTAILGAHH